MLKQTTNRDATSQQGGIAAFTRNINARKRWIISRLLQGVIVGYLMEMTGLGMKYETVKELRRQKKNTG